MSAVFATLAQAVCGAVFANLLAHVRDLAGNIGKNLAADTLVAKFREVFARRGLHAQVAAAVERALDNFAANLNDPELLDGLKRTPQFQTDHVVISTLADAALQPLEEDNQVAALAGSLQAMLPTVAFPRLKHAAEVLIQAVHDQAATIGPLREGFHDLVSREILDHVTVLDSPEYAPGLYKAIYKAADELQREFGQRHIESAHLLYAVAVQPDGVASGILARFGVTPEAIRKLIGDKIGKHEGPVDNAMTPNAAALFNRQARQIAGERGADHTRSEHVLEALARAVQHETDPRAPLRYIFERLKLPATGVQAAAIDTGQVMSRLMSSLNSFDQPPT